MRQANAKLLILAVGLACAWMQAGAIAEQRCDRLNYDESKVGDYTVPNPLLGKDGKRITDPAAWRSKRRSEILRDFRDLMYGHTPELPVKLRAQVVATRKDAVDGLATRTLVKLQFFGDPKAPHIDLMVYIPNKKTGPVPMLLGLSFTGNASIEDDPAIPLPTSWRYCDRFRDWVDRENELPFDQHMLLGLIAPRPVYVASATKDTLADPKGEFLTAMHAEPIYRLFGLRGLDTSTWPAPDTPIGHHLRTGEHAITKYDWQQYLEFAARKFKNSPSKE